jgi:RNA polymerase sigma-70 factor, ECF subfamily
VSARVPSELVAAVVGGDRGAERELAAAIGGRGSDAAALSTYLDPLALAAAGGSEPALELLLWAVDALRLSRPTIGRLVLDEASVDDVSQDVLVAVAEGIGGFRATARFTTWLYQVSRNKAIDHLRRRRGVPSPADDVASMGDAHRISSLIASRSMIAEVIGTLPTAYRDAVVLRDVEHHSYEEVADRLGLNLNTARTRIARGRALVAARLVVVR